jgi:hypothetical protein
MIAKPARVKDRPKSDVLDPVANSPATQTETNSHLSERKSKTAQTDLPQHLEIFANCVARGVKTADAAERCGRSRTSASFLRRQPLVNERIQELRHEIAQQAKEQTVKEGVEQIVHVDIEEGEIIMILAGLARSQTVPPGTRVAACRELADIFHLKTTNPREVADLTGWTTEELKCFALTGKYPTRFQAIIEKPASVSKTTADLSSEKHKLPN